jgi:hypothetical protein
MAIGSSKTSCTIGLAFLRPKNLPRRIALPLTDQYCHVRRYVPPLPKRSSPSTRSSNEVAVTPVAAARRLAAIWISRSGVKRLVSANGQVLTISGVAPDGTLQTKVGLCVPADFRQWCHGYVVISHKAQGWTADHVVVAAERLTCKGAYVACSRGRKCCIVDTPDKARLIERLPEANRRAALDVLSENRANSDAIVSRVKAWKQLSIDLAQHIGGRINKTPAAGIRIADQQKCLSHRM